VTSALGPITVEDLHTAGEPFRIVTGGIPEPQGSTVAERRLWAAAHLEDVRRLLVHEPRGHADMYGGIPVPPDDAGADLGVLFFHADGWSTACGHGTIALATWAVETGRVARAAAGPTVLHVDVPSGRLRTAVHGDGGRVRAVEFDNVPAYVAGAVEHAGVRSTVAYGGAFYAILDAADAGLSLVGDPLPELVAWCRAYKSAIDDPDRWVHPDDPRIRGVYGVILVEPAAAPDALPLLLGDEPALVQRNLTVFADAEVDRSPTGSGTSARLAALHAAGEIAVGQRLVNLSIIGSAFTGVVTGTTEVGGRPAVRTTVAGQAFPTGSATFALDPADPLGTGFRLR
jgi:proline racemase